MTHDKFIKYLPLAFYGLIFILILFVGYSINKQNRDLDKIRLRQEALIQVVKQQAIVADKQVAFSAMQAKRLSAADLKIQKMLSNQQCAISFNKPSKSKPGVAPTPGAHTVPSAPKQGESLH